MTTNSTTEKRALKFSDYLKFILPSIIGVLILMFPIKYDGNTTILVALLANTVSDAIKPILPTTILLIINLTGIITILHRIFKFKGIKNSPFLSNIFETNMFWTLVRAIGCILVSLTYFKVGPEIIWSNSTGGLILYDLLLNLFSIFFFAGFLLPFLTDFGLLEFVGVLLTPVMRPLFNLPGRSSIDCIASWIGDGTVGVALTNKQYLDGFYTAKEASIISTTFSAVSMTFSIMVLDQVGLTHLFGPYYLTILVAGFVAAIIMPRIWPLRNKPDTYYGGIKKDAGENIPDGFTNIEWGLQLAVETAEKNMSLKKLVTNGLKSAIDLWLGVLPVIMAFGTLALIIAEGTSLFQILGLPFIPLLKLLQVPYPVEASQTIMVGFSDMFLSSVIASSIPSEMTRFIIATLSVTQLVYLSEAGAVILGSDIPITPLDLFIIYIERTLITLPVIVFAAHLIF